MASSGSHPANVPCAGYVYPPGGMLKIQVNTPMQPFGDSFYAPPFNEDPHYKESKDVVAAGSAEDFVFSHQSRQRGEDDLLPVFAKPYYEAGYLDKAELHILGGLAVGANRGSQVFLCDVRKAPSRLWNAMGWMTRDFPKKVVAKVFDPLYFPKVDTIRGICHFDTVSCADKDYAHEAAAYMELHEHRKHSPLIHDLVPNFYGTFSVKHYREKSTTEFRVVRIVLMEYVEGMSIREMSWSRSDDNFLEVLIPPKEAGTQADRLAVFARFLHGLVALEHVGVFHEDFKPSNVIITSNKGKGRPKRVVLIDFNLSEVSRYTNYVVNFAQTLPRPLLPQARYSINGFDRFAGWIPCEWFEDENKSESSDSEDEEGEEPPSLFHQWAAQTFDDKDFVTVEEADKITIRQDEEAAGKARQEVPAGGEIPMEVKFAKMSLETVTSQKQTSKPASG